MKKKMRFLTCTFVVLPMLATYTYFNRSAYITKYDWKKQATMERLGVESFVSVKIPLIHINGL